MGNAASIGRELRADLSRTLRDVFLIGTQSVIDATPVDTEHDSNNWMLTTGSPYAGVDGSREAPSHSVRDGLIEKFRNYDVGRDGKIYLRNNVFYTQFLDAGSSQQAEAGFVAKAFAQGARRAGHGRKQAARKVLANVSRSAYHRGY